VRGVEGEKGGEGKKATIASTVAAECGGAKGQTYIEWVKCILGDCDIKERSGGKLSLEKNPKCTPYRKETKFPRIHFRRRRIAPFDQDFAYYKIELANFFSLNFLLL